jgi:N-acetylneuraminic acid mutarotase
MIVWGGYGPGAPVSLGTGGVYDPATDTWRPTNNLRAPTASSRHTAVWTGSRMVVWGGTPFPDHHESVVFDIGWQYDPSSDRWTRTSKVGAPVGRMHHTAVWTGSRMIVWGGWGARAYLDSGGVYDPSTDHWTATSLSDAPIARWGHTAVWTGSRMIVWGGFGDEGACLDSGGIYDPSTDTWTSISALGAPAARCDHTAVWTGSAMIVWGGTPAWDSASYLNTGGIYDPATNSWQVTSLTGAPRPRLAHTAVWTRAGMIVWGGLAPPSGPSPGALGNGGVYNPSTDTWTSSRIWTEAPSPRLAHTAVWTGSRMIVWGGHDNLQTLDTGGAYTPVGRARRLLPETVQW